MERPHDLGNYRPNLENVVGFTKEVNMIEETRYSKKINWILFAFFVVLMCVMLFYFDRAIAADTDAKAMEIAKKTITAMGGMDNWKGTMAVRFNFVVEPQGQPSRAVKHLWDRKNNRDHVEGTKDGKPMIAWVDMGRKSGAAWYDGKKLEGEELQKAMDWAFGRWVNDTYWLIMPFKLLDSGVNLKYEGAKAGHDILHVSFGKVGLTPGDQYWAFINQQTGLMDQWKYLLEEKDKGDFAWKEWGDYGKIKLSKHKVSSDGKFGIRFEPLQVMDSADPSYFTQELRLLQ
jgi:hypothetical protein